MNAAVLFPNSPILSFVASEQRQSAVSSGNRNVKVANKKMSKAHRRRQHHKRKSTSRDEIITVIVEGHEHRVKVSALKHGVAKALLMKSPRKTDGNQKRSQNRSESRKSSKKKCHDDSKKKKSKSAIQKMSMNESGGMLPEERAFQMSIHPAQPKDDVSLERKQRMIRHLDQITRYLTIQCRTLPEEHAYQLLIRPQETFRRQQVLKKLAAMKRRINQGILPQEESYLQLMEEVSPFTAHGKATEPLAGYWTS